MGRLIDADALKDFILSVIKEQKGRKIDLVKVGEVIQVIDLQPTAYDVEKVIEDLSSNSRFIDDINEHNIKCISCVVGQKTAIDIVKRGGVE